MLQGSVPRKRIAGHENNAWGQVRPQFRYRYLKILSTEMQFFVPLADPFSLHHLRHDPTWVPRREWNLSQHLVDGFQVVPISFCTPSERLSFSLSGSSLMTSSTPHRL